MRFRAHAGTFLFFCLALMLATGVYQRVANPALSYHLDHPVEEQNTPQAPLPQAPLPQPSGPGMRMTPEQSEKLAHAMAELKENPNDAAILLRIATIFSDLGDRQNAERFAARAAAERGK